MGPETAQKNQDAEFFLPVLLLLRLLPETMQGLIGISCGTPCMHARAKQNILGLGKPATHTVNLPCTFL